MTDLRYLDDSSVDTFEATVDRTLDDRLVLDATHFYPEGGGQPADRGTIEADGRTWNVTDVRKKDTVYHTLDGGNLPPVGTTVTGRLDWPRREAHMRYHTAQHLLSALLLEEFDARTIGNQIRTDRARLDAAYDRFSEDDLAYIENRMNDLVDDARPVTWSSMDRETAERTLDSERTRIDLLPESIETLRIVEVEGYDRTACAGTHVENTADVGRVRVTGRTTQGAEAERLSFTLE
ncbi:alanyl-tRNA editing protein [Halomarina ordinaria]|uniref:Alanyl-tRNA editing protein n=1 Tax=Halomarina ordinaria TaxID=3033939 RepID=A0ABD5UBV1_9EURY|nr:alanyl-tRNA editing protein [Halomarina sp. PSRA2]